MKSSIFNESNVVGHSRSESRWPIQKEEVSVMMKKDNDDDDDDDDLCNEMMTWEINTFPKY